MKRLEKAGHSDVIAGLARLVPTHQCEEDVICTDRQESLVFHCHDKEYYYEGFTKKPMFVLAEVGKDRTIEVDMKKKVLRVNGEAVSGIEHKQVLDLNDDGERWEGDVLHREPFGWGVLYDSENRRSYEGFRIGDVNVCYGTRYYSDIQKVEYEGGICEGKRWGRGVQYNRKGEVVFFGEWMNDGEKTNRIVVVDGGIDLLHSFIEELRVCDDCCNGEEWKAFDFSFLLSLKELAIGHKCFKCVKDVKLIGMKKLERVTIGKECFVGSGDEYDDPNGCFYLKDCERVRELKICCGSFPYYATCVVSDNDHLKEIEIQDRCFQKSVLELKSMFTE